MLELPEMVWDSDMFRAVVSEIEPAPRTANLLFAFGKLIVPLAKAVRLLSMANATVPAKVMLPKGLLDVPVVRVAVKSGSELIVRASAGSPQLIVREPAGLAK